MGFESRLCQQIAPAGSDLHDHNVRDGLLDDGQHAGMFRERLHAELDFLFSVPA